jgi:DNA-binding Xre family transcriptional regulator
MIQDGTGLSAATIARFKSPGMLAAFESATVEKLCRFLDCQFADIVEHVEDSLDE